MHGEHLLDSGALQNLNKILGATGGEQHTYIDSSNLQLSMDANDIVRRGRTFASSQGIFAGRIANTHGVPAATVFGEVDPYAIASPAAGFPSPLPEGFDVWLLSSVAYRTSGDALVSAEVAIAHPAVKMAFGTAALVIDPLRSYQIATLGELAICGVQWFRSIGDGLIQRQHPTRIPRGSTLYWVTAGAGGAAAVYTADFTLGVFPAALGQDAIGAG